VQVDAAGRPETVQVRVSSGFASLDQAAVAAVESWEFEPGRLDGEPVASQVEVPIQFRLGP
jgi:protein TonB